MIYDLTHPLQAGMPVFPGDPEFRVAPWPVAPPWHVSEFSLGSHSGTHVDAPAHIGRDRTIEALPPEQMIGIGVVIDVPNKGPGDRIGVDDLGETRAVLQDGVWVIFRTGWSRYWQTPAYFAHPSLHPDLAQALVTWGVGLVGVDLLNPDDTQSGAGTIHEILLGADIPIVENLTNLELLAAGRLYTFAFLPLRLTGADGSPVRAVAWEGQTPGA
jgi:kynurenine formamidase